MSHAFNNSIRKLWKTGKYNSKRELVQAVCDKYNIDINSKDEYVQETIWVIKREAENAIQSGNGKWMYKIK